MNLVNRTVYQLMKALSALACRLGRARAMAAGAAFADGLYGVYRLTPYRGFVEGNIRAAFPTMGPAEAVDLGRAHLRQLVRAIVELMRFPVLSDAELDAIVAWPDRRHLDEALESGKGVVFVSAHFGNWEILGAALSRLVPLTVIVQPPSQGAFERLFVEYRAMRGIRTLPNTGKVSLRPALRALRRGEAVALLADQHGEAQEAIATLFAHPVSVPMGPFYLAKKSGATLLPVFIARQSDLTHRVMVGPPLPATGEPEDAQAYCEVLEAQVREHADHWLWVHDRWARESELRAGALERVVS
ncbi:lysophospholipid acyltransferase family protein [bacterium]|nr:lysophospholipid acyltransferase family protein [bacterium]